MDQKSIQTLVEMRMKEIQEKQNRLAEMWKPHIDLVEEYIQQKQNRSLDDYERRNIAQVLENALDEGGIKSRMRLFEATTEDNISFLGIQLPVIAALLPSLTLNEFATTQALDRRVGAVFFLDVTANTTKGGVTAGDTLLAARTGHARTETARKYASTMIRGEAISGSAGGSGTVTGTLSFAPGVDVTYGTIVVRDGNGDDIGNDSASAGTVAGSNCTGTVTSAGVYSLAPVTTWDSDGITIDYEYQYDKPVDAYNDYSGVPEMDVNITQETVRAIDFPVRGKYSLGASIDLQKAHGINLENEVIKYLGGEVRFTIDHHGVDLIDDCSINGAVVSGVTQTPATAIGEWDATVGSGQEWLWKKHEFLKEIETGNMNIITKTLRAMASYIIAGNNVAALIKQMPGDKFKPAGGMNKTAPTGPVKIGTLDGRPVIHDPLLLNRRIASATVQGANRYILGWKGSNFLTSGFVYLPYIPLFATPTLVTSDLFAQKGFLSSAGFKVINAGMFTYGTITGY